jgi:hypothetical protein
MVVFFLYHLLQKAIFFNLLLLFTCTESRSVVYLSGQTETNYNTYYYDKHYDNTN